jgi:hypothetical protein
MIKAIRQKTKYLIYDEDTALSLFLTVSEDDLQLTNEDDDKEFNFSSDNTKEVQERWRNVARLIEKAMDMVERHKKQVNEFV